VGAEGSGGAAAAAVAVAAAAPPLSTADGLRLAVVWRARENTFARIEAQIRQIESELGNARAKAQTAKDAVKSIPGLSGKVAAKAAAAKDRAAAT